MCDQNKNNQDLNKLDKKNGTFLFHRQGIYVYAVYKILP